MRPAPIAFSIVLIATALVALGARETRASLLPQIQMALENQESEGDRASALTKHFVEVRPGVHVAVKGRRERRQVRMARWVESLEGDRRSVYEHAGFPRYRHRENFQGVVTEHWTYPGVHATYVFRGDKLLRKGRF